MSAIEEIRAGHPGELTLAVAIRSAARATADLRPPEGFGIWSRGALEEVLSALLEEKPFIFSQALEERVADDGALEAWLLRVIRNFWIDDAKSTEVGKMRRRLPAVLRGDDRFVHLMSPTESWALVEFAAVPFSGDVEGVRRAAGQVRGLYLEKLNAGGRTPKPVADVIRGVIAAVLTDEAGAVPAQVLAQLVLERLFPAAAPVKYLNEDSEPEESFTDVGPGPDFQVLIDTAARSVFASLSQAERDLVPFLGLEPGERVGVLPGVGANETEALVASVMVKIRWATRDDEDFREVVAALLHMCEQGS